MLLKDMYRQAVEAGISKDPRSRELIDRYLAGQKEKFERLSGEEKAFFDPDSLWNPFADTRILEGDLETEVRRLYAGIDIDSAELLAASQLKEKPDLVLAHHPQGKAFVTFYEVMDLQVDIFSEMGISLSEAERLVEERKKEVERKVIASNYNKTVDTARMLSMNFMCVHTPADNHAYSFMRDLLHKERPKKLKEIITLLLSIPEYRKSAEEQCPPRIIAGTPDARVENIHVDFTGGTEGPQKTYERLSALGVDTIIGMHFSEEHFKCLTKARLNALVAGHIASDNLGFNLVIDELEKTAGTDFAITCCSGFRRFPHR